MKSIFLSLFVLLAVVCFNSCKNDKKETSPAATETPAAPAPAATEAQAAPAPAQSTEPAQNAKGIWHYTCPKGCEGGAGIQTSCAKCGGPLQHNAAYHAQ